MKFQKRRECVPHPLFRRACSLSYSGYNIHVHTWLSVYLHYIQSAKQFFNNSLMCVCVCVCVCVLKHAQQRVCLIWSQWLLRTLCSRGPIALCMMRKSTVGCQFEWRRTTIWWIYVCLWSYITIKISLIQHQLYQHNKVVFSHHMAWCIICLEICMSKKALP
jgi:hypothetical protein